VIGAHQELENMKEKRRARAIILLDSHDNYMMLGEKIQENESDSNIG